MAEARKAFSIDVKVGESVSIDRGRIFFTVLEKTGQRAKIGFDVPESVRVEKLQTFNAGGSGAEQAKKGIGK